MKSQTTTVTACPQDTPLRRHDYPQDSHTPPKRGNTIEIAYKSVNVITSPRANDSDSPTDNQRRALGPNDIREPCRPMPNNRSKHIEHQAAPTLIMNFTGERSTPCSNIARHTRHTTTLPPHCPVTLQLRLHT